MDFVSQLNRCLFVICLLFSIGVSAGTGVAFVHGTGSQSDAYNDYWTAEMIDSVSQGLDNPNNYLVVNCDFDQYVWTEAAAGCLATQLEEFIGSNSIDDLIVITHSNGGNVIRWILSNPTADIRYPDIVGKTRWVIALAPSSLGTPLADAVINGSQFEQVLGWLLGYSSDAVRMQQTSFMAYLNQNWFLGTRGRPELPANFASIVGTDVESSPLDLDSYCGGYPETLALEVTQTFLDSCSDGFLNCSSQAGVDDVFIPDKYLTEGQEPLNHNQSRRPCFDLDIRLRNFL